MIDALRTPGRLRRKPAPTYAVLLLVAAAACGRAPAEEIETSASVPVRTITIEPRGIEGVVAVTGAVTPAPGADWAITAPEAARIAELPKAEGDPVRPGDLLVRFDIPSLDADAAARRAELDQARARLENATAASKRLRTLVEHGVAAQKELEDARRELAEAAAAVEQARAAVASVDALASRRVVRARFAGVVARRTHNPGDLVDPSAAEPILRIIDPARLQVVASVPIAALPRVRTGQRASVLDPSGTSHTARVLTTPVAVERTAVTGDVRLAFDSPVSLAAGTPVQVQITTERHDGVLVVPAVALVRDGDATYVLVVDREHKAHRRAVTTGLQTEKDAEITSGLQRGDLVVVQGQQGLPDGGAVTVVS